MSGRLAQTAGDAINAVMLLSNRKEKRMVLCRDGTDALERGREFILSKKWKRAHVYLLSGSDGPGRGITGTMTITPPKRTTATAAAPGAADANQVHGDTT